MDEPEVSILFPLLASTFLSSWCLPVSGWTILFCVLFPLHFNYSALLSILVFTFPNHCNNLSSDSDSKVGFQILLKSCF
jgi:hypothetical protein